MLSPESLLEIGRLPSQKEIDILNRSPLSDYYWSGRLRLSVDDVRRLRGLPDPKPAPDRLCHIPADMVPEIAARLHEKTRRGAGPTRQCWVWGGGKTPFGHGRMKIAGRLQSPHRVAFIIAYGPIPDDPSIDVMHICDVPACVRPLHLQLGSRRDNMLDASRKGRLGKGKAA